MPHPIPWPPPGWQALSPDELLTSYLERVAAEAECWRDCGEVERASECEAFVRTFRDGNTSTADVPPTPSAPTCLVCSRPLTGLA